MNVNPTTATALPLEVDCDELAKKLPQLLGEERSTQTSFLLHLAAFDRVKGYERMGYATLWDYCRQELGLLEGATFRRVHAARLLDRYPQARELLLDGRLYMTTLVQLEKIITDENADDLFALAARKSKAEVEYLVLCRLKPAAVGATEPMPAAVVRKAPVGRQVVAATADVEDVAKMLLLPIAAAPRSAMVQPIAEDRFTIKLTVSKAFVDALEEAKLVLSHRVPGGEVEAVLRAALEDLIARDAKRNAPKEKAKKKVVEAKVVERSAPSPQPPPVGRGSLMAALSSDVEKGGRMATSSSGSRSRMRSRSVPAAVRRAVWARDGGCCAWRKADGTSCGSRWQLELDHVVAFALGGDSSVANLRLLCAAHNAQHARETFGEERIRVARGATSSSGSGAR